MLQDKNYDTLDTNNTKKIPYNPSNNNQLVITK